MDQYVMTENPTECPKCGARTKGVDLPDGSERHKCDACGYEFLMFPDFDGEEQCSACREFAPAQELEANGGRCTTCVTNGVKES